MYVPQENVSMRAWLLALQTSGEGIGDSGPGNAMGHLDKSKQKLK